MMNDLIAQFKKIVGDAHVLTACGVAPGLDTGSVGTCENLCGE
jgi:hypothetical protein